MKEKLKIRKGIFETNSSSSHSFSIGTEDKFVQGLQVSPRGVIEVSSGDWPRKTNDATEKLSYLLSFAYTISFGDKTKWRTWRDLIFSVVKEFTGAKKIKFSEKEYDIEEIDHQSTDIIDPRDLENPEFIKKFIFSENTWLYVIWDSESPEKGFYEDVSGETGVAFIFRFNFPGLQDPVDVPVSYRDTQEEEITYILSDYLEDIYYNPETEQFERHTQKIDPGTLKTPPLPDNLWGYIGYDETVYSWGSRNGNKIEVCPEIVF